MAWSGDGHRLLTAGVDGSARLWDGRSGAAIATLQAGQVPILAAALDLGGRLAVTGDAVGTIRVFDLARRRQVAALESGGAIGSIAIDGDEVLTAGDSGAAMLWRLPRGRLVRSLVHGDRLDQAVFSPDHRWIATAGRDGTARVWNRATGDLVTTLRGHQGAVRSIAFDPGSSRLVTASDDRTAAVWDRASGRRIALFVGHPGPVASARFSPDGKRVVTASLDGSARVWKVSDFYRTGGLGPVTGPCFRDDTAPGVHDSRFAALACAGGVQVWDLERGARVAVVAPDGRGDGAASSAAAAAAARKPGPAAVDDAGERVATAWGRVATIHALPDGRVLDRVTAGGAITVIEWMPGADSGRALLIASEDGVVRIWRRGRPAVTLRGHRGAVTAAAFSPDGHLVATGDQAGGLRLFDLRTGALVAQVGTGNPAQGLVLSPDGAILAAVPAEPAIDPTLWDVRRRRRIADLSGHVSSIFGLRFSRDSARIVTASGDGVARIWQARSGRLLGVLGGSPQYLTGASFDPDGELVVTTGGDGALRFWDATSFRLMWLLDTGEPGRDVRFLDRSHLVSRALAGGIAFWTLDRPDRSLPALERMVRCLEPAGDRETFSRPCP